MIFAVGLALVAVLLAGAYLATSRDLLRCLIGLTLFGNGVNLLLYAAGRFLSTVPPVIKAAETQLGQAANPLPQALVLTAIVIGFALLAFSLVLAERLIQVKGSHDLLELRSAEPPAGADDRPVVEEAP